MGKHHTSLQVCNILCARFFNVFYRFYTRIFLLPYFFYFNIALLHLILKLTVMLFWIWDFFLSSDPSICYTKESPFIEIFQCCCLSFHYFLPNLNGVLPFHRTAFEILVPFGTDNLLSLMIAQACSFS